MTQNREVSTFFPAAEFCQKPYQRLYLPAKAPPSLLSASRQFKTCSKIGAASFLLPGTSADLLVRCGLCSTSVQSLHLVACTFSAYHATKHSFLRDFESHASVPTDKYWISFAQSLSAEAAERRLTNTRFDPCMFKQFFGIDLQT